MNSSKLSIASAEAPRSCQCRNVSRGYSEGLWGDVPSEPLALVLGLLDGLVDRASQRERSARLEVERELRSDVSFVLYDVRSLVAGELERRRPTS
jgi:hypothetical protein